MKLAVNFHKLFWGIYLKNSNSSFPVIEVFMTPACELDMHAIGKDIKKFTKSLNLYAMYGNTRANYRIEARLAILQPSVII